MHLFLVLEESDDGFLDEEEWMKLLKNIVTTEEKDKPKKPKKNQYG